MVFSNPLFGNGTSYVVFDLAGPSCYPVNGEEVGFKH